MTNTTWMTKISTAEYLQLGGAGNPALRSSLDAQGNWQYFKPDVPVGRPGRSAKADRRMVADWMDRFERARGARA